MDAANIEALRSLHAQPESTNCAWGSKVQNVCSAFWAALPDDDVDEGIARTFINLLQNQDALAVAQLVILDLRPNADTESLSLSKRRIVAAIQPALDEQLWPVPPKFQAHIDTPSYRAEKHAYHDADMYRVKLHLRRSEKSKPEEEEEILKWLEQCPVKPTPGEA